MGGEDPLEEEMATDSNILAWEIPWTEEPGGLQSMGSQKSQIDLETKQQLHKLCFFLRILPIYEHVLILLNEEKHALKPRSSNYTGVCSLFIASLIHSSKFSLNDSPLGKCLPFKRDVLSIILLG